MICIIITSNFIYYPIHSFLQFEHKIQVFYVCILCFSSHSLTHPATLFTASLLVGGTRKQMDGTVASLPLSFSTLHLKGCELFSRAHSSPRCTMICRGTSRFPLGREATGIRPTLKKQADGEGRAAHLHLLEVADGLDGLLALDCRRRVARFQLHNGLGPSHQTLQVSFKLGQLLLLILKKNSGSK